jgi:hypothetical protein
MNFVVSDGSEEGYKTAFDLAVEQGLLTPTTEPSVSLTANTVEGLEDVTSTLALAPEEDGTANSAELADPEMVVAEQITPLENETDESATEPQDLDEDPEDGSDFAEVEAPAPLTGPSSQDIRQQLDDAMAALPGLEAFHAQAAFAVLTDPKAKSTATKALKNLQAGKDEIHHLAAVIPLVEAQEADHAERTRIYNLSLIRAKFLKNRDLELSRADALRSELAEKREALEAAAAKLEAHDAARNKLVITLEVAQDHVTSRERRIIAHRTEAERLLQEAITTLPTEAQIKRRERREREAARERYLELAEETRRTLEAMAREDEKRQAAAAEEAYQNEMLPTIKGWHEGKILHEDPRGNSYLDGICYSEDRGDMVARKDIPAWEAEQARLMTKYVGTGIKRRPNMFAVRGSAVGAHVPAGFGEQPTAGEPLTYLTGERNNHGVSPTAEKQLKKLQGRAYVEPKEYSGENLVAPKHRDPTPRRLLPGNMEHGTVEADRRHGWLHGYRFPMVAA